MSYVKNVRASSKPQIHTSIWYVLLIIGPSYDKVIIKNYTPRKIHTNAQVKCSYLNQPSG